MYLIHKIRLVLNNRQRHYLARAAGTHRFVWNWALAEWIRQYEAGGKPSGYSLKKQFNAIYKEQFPWIAETHRDCHMVPFLDLQDTFSRFFKGINGKPNFKKKNKEKPSVCFVSGKYRIDGKRVRLERLGWVKMREELRFKGKPLSARVVEEGGEWYICVSVDVGDIKKERDGDGVVGVDLGIAKLAMLSTGEQIANPRPFKKALRKLRRAQRKLSRRVKGSNNRGKQRRMVAKIHRRVRNIRHDGLHKLTTRLCRENQTVVIEDLNVKGMVKNHSLARSISDVGFGLFRRFLAYKAQMYGTSIIVADRFFPSSKTCSSCGAVKDVLSLGERTYQCGCGLELDRDLNAALNLVKLGRVAPEVTPVDRCRSWALVESGTETDFVDNSDEPTPDKQFTCIIRRHGLWRDDVKDFVDAALRAKQRVQLSEDDEDEEIE